MDFVGFFKSVYSRVEGFGLGSSMAWDFGVNVLMCVFRVDVFGRCCWVYKVHKTNQKKHTQINGVLVSCLLGLDI